MTGQGWLIGEGIVLPRDVNCSDVMNWLCQHDVLRQCADMVQNISQTLLLHEFCF